MKATLTILTSDHHCECCGHYSNYEAKIEVDGKTDYRSRDNHLSGNERWQDESSYSEPYISIINLLGYAVYFKRLDRHSIDSTDSYLSGFNIDDQLRTLKEIGVVSPREIHVTIAEIDYDTISAKVEMDGEVKYGNSNCSFDSLIKEIVENLLKCEVTIEDVYENNIQTEDY